jgi:hypothetical protein
MFRALRKAVLSNSLGVAAQAGNVGNRKTLTSIVIIKHFPQP